MIYLLIAALIALGFYAFKLRGRIGQIKKDKNQIDARFQAYKDSSEIQNKSYRENISRLSKYEHIANVDEEANRIEQKAVTLQNSIKSQYDSKIKEAIALGEIEVAKAQEEANRIQKEAITLQESTKSKYEAKIAEAISLGKAEITKAREKVKELQGKAESKLSEAHELASEIERTARERAEAIAGDALKAKENAERYESVEKAMRNVIKGYGDDYLSPNRPIVDSLAEEYDFKEAGQKLNQTKALVKSLLHSGRAADCSYVEEYRKRTAVEFVLDAFNGKVDSIMSQIKAHNFDKLEEQIVDAYNIVNHNGKAFRDAHVTKAYLDATLDQLKWATVVQKIKQEDRAEQQRIKEQIREEEKARREYERALKDAEKEERLLQKAMKEAESKLLVAADEERVKYEAEIEKLRASLEEAYARGERAMSMAQQTKQGHVYVISNIGSFGEEIFKVGLTRRLEPMDRVKELGDASVPFEFDVHAMVFSTDAPSLEKRLHGILEAHRINKINPRKEFFKVPLTEIREVVEKSGYEVRWTVKAEAVEYRESLKLQQALDVI